MFFYESHKVDVEQGLDLSWKGTVDNSRPILPLKLGLFPRCTAVTSQRTHFFFCNLKVKIIQGRFRKNICDCQINQVSMKRMENISVRNQREARQMIMVRVTERPLQRDCSGLVPLCALSSPRLRGEAPPCRTPQTSNSELLEGRNLSRFLVTRIIEKLSKERQ